MVREKYKAPMGWGHQSARAAGIRPLQSGRARPPLTSDRSPCRAMMHPYVERSGVPRNTFQPQMCEEIRELKEKKETPGCVVC